MTRARRRRLNLFGLLVAGLLATTTERLLADKQVNPPNWGIDRIDQPHGTNGVFRWSADGSGVHVYIIDSGVRTTHQEFGGRAVFEANFCPDTSNPTGADDDHGTHNASIAAGATVGIARNATIHSLRAFGPGCENHTDAERASYMVSALQWVIDHGQKPGVVNFSAGSLNQDSVRQKVLEVAHAGFPIAVSAACTANAAALWGTAAANQQDGVFIAGSIDQSDNASPNVGDYGPSLTMFAPAVHLIAAMNTSDSAYGEIVPADPTCADSFAAPHIAGVIATYLQNVRTLETPAQLYADIINGTPGQPPLWVSGVASNRHTAPDRILQSVAPDRLDRNSLLTRVNVTHSVWSTAQDGTSANPGNFQLVYTSTGDLVLQDASGAAVWDANTSSPSPGFARMQGDGNFVIYSGSPLSPGPPYWTSNTFGNPGAALTVNDDGTFVIKAPDGTHLWWSGPGGNGRMSANYVLYPQQYVASVQNGYRLTYEASGELFLRDSSGGVVWHNGVGTGSPGTAQLGNDGNLVLYNSGGASYWQTSTGGHPGAFLKVEDDGDVRILDADGITVLWETGTHPGPIGTSVSTNDSNVATRATFLTPTNGQTINTSGSVKWTNVAQADAYQLQVGTAKGLNNLADSGQTTTTSYPAASLPSASNLAVRVWSRVAGAWYYADNYFTSAAGGTPILSESFANNTYDSSKWMATNLWSGTEDAAVHVQVVGNRLQIGPLLQTTGVHYNGLATVNAYDLTNGYASAQVVQAPATNTTAYAMFSVGVNSSNYYRIYESNGTLFAQKNIAGSKVDIAAVPYNSAMHQFWRVRHESYPALGVSRVFFETAPAVNGAPGEWRWLWSENWDEVAVPPTGVKFEMKAGTSVQEANAPGTVIFDNFAASHPATTPESVLLSDDFAGSFDTTKWSHTLISGSQDTSVPVAQTDGSLQVGELPFGSNGTAHYNGVRTVNAYDLTGSYAQVEAIRVPTPAAAGAYMMFTAAIDSSHHYRMYENGGTVSVERKIGTAKTILGSIAFSLSATPYWRIRHNEANNTVYFEVAPTATSATWTVVASEVAQFAVTSLVFELKAGVTDAQSVDPGMAWFDNFRAARQ